MSAIYPDLILTGGKVVTVDADFTIAQAVAIQGDRICAVGSTQDVLALAAPHTRIVELAGKTVVPGLIDGHAHLDREGLRSVFPSLGKVRSIADVQAAIADLVRRAPKGEWIVTMPLGDAPAYADVERQLAEGRFPTRHDLDAVSPDHPVYIRAIWGYWRHTMPLVSIANTKALELAGIGPDTPAPSDLVTIEKDEQGMPTGVFREQTLMPIVELAFFNEPTRFSREARTQALPRSVQAYHAYGTTSVFEGHGVASDLLQAYRAARADGQLRMRATLAVSPNWASVPDVAFDTFIEAWCGWLSGQGLGDDFLRIAGFFVDIGPDANNVTRARAYPDTGWAGFNYDTARTRERAIELLTACARHRIQVTAIWPNMLELFYEVHQRVPLDGLRWVFSHISVLNARQIQMIREMGLIVTTHTNRYVFKEGHQLLASLGADRADEIVPLRALVDAGIPVVLASDNVPVSLFHPFWHAVARTGRDNREAIAPGQALTREQALRAVTCDAARLTWDEDCKGSIEVGKFADLAVLDRDVLLCPDAQIAGTVSVLTIVGGDITHQTTGQ